MLRVESSFCHMDTGLAIHMDTREIYYFHYHHHHHHYRKYTIHSTIKQTHNSEAGRRPKIALRLDLQLPMPSTSGLLPLQKMHGG